MSKHQIRPASLDDAARIKEIAVHAGMFTVEEVAFFDEMIEGSLTGEMERHQWIVIEIEGSIAGAANYAPEPFSDRLWNLYFIAVDPTHQARGIGSALMAHAESALVAKTETEARVLIVETSSTDQFALARDFYRKLKFDEEARIREFYGPGDDKVVFWKSLVSDAST